MLQHFLVYTVMLEKGASTLNSANCVRCFPLALFWCALIRLPHMRVCLALAVVAQIKIAHDMQMSNFVQIAQYYSANCVRCFPLALFWCALIRLPHMRVCLALAVVAQIKIAHDMQMSNFVQIAQYYSANCVRCFPLALFWCALIRLPHMRVCLALAVVAQIKIAHDMQMSNFVQIAQYYSQTFF